MKISYAITVCNEHKEIERLLTFLFEHKRIEDQVIVQMDLNATNLLIIFTMILIIYLYFYNYVLMVMYNV